MKQLLVCYNKDSYLLAKKYQTERNNFSRYHCLYIALTSLATTKNVTFAPVKQLLKSSLEQKNQIINIFRCRTKHKIANSKTIGLC